MSPYPLGHFQEEKQRPRLALDVIAVDVNLPHASQASNATYKIVVVQLPCQHWVIKAFVTFDYQTANGTAKPVHHDNLSLAK
jgi:hypothetical protein